MDTAQATAQPVPVTIAGRTFLVRVRRVTELGPLQSLYKKTIPSPLEAAYEALSSAEQRGQKLTEATRRLALSQAHREARCWPPRIFSLPWIVDINEAGRTADVVLFALQPEHPELSLDDVEALCRNTTSDELLWLVTALFRGLGENDVPKASPGAEGAAPTPTTTPSPTSTTCENPTIGGPC